MIYFVLFVFFARQIAPRSIARASRVAGTASQPGCFSEMHRGRVEPFMSPEDLGERLCSDSLGRSQQGQGSAQKRKEAEGCSQGTMRGVTACVMHGAAALSFSQQLYLVGDKMMGLGPFFPPLSWRGLSASLFAVTAGSFTSPIHTLLPIPTLCLGTSLHQGQFVTIILRFTPINTMRCPH